MLAGYCTLTGQSGDCTGYVGIKQNGVTTAEYGAFVPGNTWFSYSICVYDSAPGNALYQLIVRSPASGPGATCPLDSRLRPSPQQGVNDEHCPFRQSASFQSTMTCSEAPPPELGWITVDDHVSQFTHWFRDGVLTPAPQTITVIR